MKKGDIVLLSFPFTDLNGLKKTSLVRVSKITTIDKDLILGKLGELDSLDMQNINKSLIKILNL